MADILVDGGVLPNPVRGTTYTFEGFNSNPGQNVPTEIIKTNLRRLTVAEADARINDWNYSGWNGITLAGSFARFDIDGITGRPKDDGATSDGYIFFETQDDNGNPLTPWRPWWPKASARNTYFEANASGDQVFIEEFEYYPGNFIEVENDRYWSVDGRNLQIEPMEPNQITRMIGDLYGKWLVNANTTSVAPNGVTLSVPAQVRTSSDNQGESVQNAIWYGFTRQSEYVYNGVVAPYVDNRALVTPITRTDGTSTASSYTGATGLAGLYDDMSTAGKYGTDASTWLSALNLTETGQGVFRTVFQTIDQYIDTYYQGVEASSVVEEQYLPLYMENNSTMRRMSISTVIDKFIKPTIKLMCGEPADSGYPENDYNGISYLPYSVAASQTLSGYRIMNNRKIYIDYKADESWFNARTVDNPDMADPIWRLLQSGYSIPLSEFTSDQRVTDIPYHTVVNSFYLHRKNLFLWNRTGPYNTYPMKSILTIDSLGNIRPYPYDSYISNILYPLLCWAMINLSGYRIRYVVKSSRTPETTQLADAKPLLTRKNLGSTMTDTKNSGYWVVAQYVNTDDYRTQYLPSSGTNADQYGAVHGNRADQREYTHNLQIVRY